MDWHAMVHRLFVLGLLCAAGCSQERPTAKWEKDLTEGNFVPLPDDLKPPEVAKEPEFVVPARPVAVEEVPPVSMPVEPPKVQPLDDVPAKKDENTEPGPKNSIEEQGQPTDRPKIVITMPTIE